MGQKSHPTGVRVGINRKWNTTWFAEGEAYKSSFFAQYQAENFFKSFFYFYSSIKSSKIKRVWLVDLKWFRSGLYQLYVFIFFYKFKSKKRKLIKRKRLKSWRSYTKINLRRNANKNRSSNNKKFFGKIKK
jgi:hypothetical protein